MIDKTTLTILINILNILFILYLIFIERKNYRSLILWIVTFISFPVIGWVIFYFLGRGPKLKRTYLEGKTLDVNGFLSDIPNKDAIVDLSQTGVNAFGLDTLVPGSTYTATFNLKNTGTTAFTSKISFTNLDGENEYLLKQIKVTTEFGSNKNTYTLDQYRNISIDFGTLTKGSDINFKIGLELLEATNNDAQDSIASFDLKLEATQVTKA